MPSHPAVVLLGLPTDEASSFARGAAAGPAALRRAFYSESSNLATEAGLDLADEPRFSDLGDLELDGGEATRSAIEAAIAEQLAAGGRVLSLGGDHSVAYPILRAYGRHHPSLTVVQLDAHPDLYDSFEGDRFSHACPFARVMEEGLAKRLVQIGIRTANEHQREQAERFGVEIVARRAWSDLAALELEPPVYLSIDLDALDPAYAPGVAHPESGGLTSREALEVICHVSGLVGADVVELNPERDVGGVTAVLASKLVKELTGRLLAG
ncbi:MAG: agmatinase [Acidobacteria bacterium]|nr:agmatinase [Acidobacteriota bacterium]